MPQQHQYSTNTLTKCSVLRVFVELHIRLSKISSPMQVSYTFAISRIKVLLYKFPPIPPPFHLLNMRAYAMSRMKSYYPTGAYVNSGANTDLFVRKQNYTHDVL